MIEAIITFIQVYLLPLGAFGVFLASVIEEIIAPLPSAMVIFASGFLLVSGPISMGSISDLLLHVALPAAAGVVLGSLLVYYIAYYMGKPVLDRWGKWFGLSWKNIEDLQQRFSETRFDEWSLFVIRAVPIVPSVVISAFCGLVRFPVRSYILYSFLGLCVRATILGFLGWQIGALYFTYAEVIGLFEDIILYSLIAGVILFLLYRKFRKS